MESEFADFGLLTHGDLRESLGPPIYLLSFFFVVAAMVRVTRKTLSREDMTREMVRAFLPLSGVIGLAFVLSLDALTPISWWMFLVAYPLTVGFLISLSFVFSLLLSWCVISARLAESEKPGNESGVVQK